MGVFSGIESREGSKAAFVSGQFPPHYLLRLDGLFMGVDHVCNGNALAWLQCKLFEFCPRCQASQAHGADDNRKSSFFQHHVLRLRLAPQYRMAG